MPVAPLLPRSAVSQILIQNIETSLEPCLHASGKISLRLDNPVHDRILLPSFHITNFLPSGRTLSDRSDVTTHIQQVPVHDITAAILAGGRGARLGGVDKGLEELSGQPLVAHIIAALKPQCGTLLINANRNQPRYADFGYPVVADDSGEFLGPLAGMLSVLRAAQTHYVLCVPCDAPLLPADLTARLWQALVQNQAQASVARSVDGLQPVYALLDRSLADRLHAFLNSGARKTADWLRAMAAAEADFSDCPSMFLNMNTTADRAMLLRTLQEASPC